LNKYAICGRRGKMKYEIIYADPPWSYNDKMKGTGFEIEKQYNTMSLDELKKMPIKDIAKKDCVLLMWFVYGMLPEALQLVDSWGFKYKTIAFIWNKKSKHGKDVYTMGRWTLSNTESVLLATRGACSKFKTTNSMKQYVEAQRTRHSEKPNIVRQKIVELFGDRPRLEMFARQKFDGWDVFGNEVDGSIKI